MAGAGMYYYVLDEYKVSNEMLTEDIYVCFLECSSTGIVGGRLMVVL